MDIKLKGEMESMENSRIYQVEEVAKILGISKSYVYQLIKEEKIPFVRLGSKVIIPKKKFDDWFDNL